MRHARESAKGALETRVYDCSESPVGTLILRLAGRGEELEVAAKHVEGK